jgi:REP element-mobilizing transposase RayT
MPRRQLVDVAVTRYYHCISRCVRRAFLCGEGFEHRKAWIEGRLEMLARQFAVSVCGFAILDSHLHVLCRLDPGVADNWADEDVVRRWITVYPPSCLDAANPATLQAWIDRECQDPARVARYRQRLQDLGWFMKALKEPLARLANKEDGCKGTFWEARYKSIAILDEQALLATCASIDLNPVAAGIAQLLERHESKPISSNPTGSARSRSRRGVAGGRPAPSSAPDDPTRSHSRSGYHTDQRVPSCTSIANSRRLMSHSPGR